MYKPFGYDIIPDHLQGYRILPKHIADLFPPLLLQTKEHFKLKWKLSWNDFTYKDYNGPFK